MRTTRFILAGAMVLLSAAGLSWGQAMQPMDTAPSFVGSKIVTELSGDQEIGSIATRAVGKAYFDVRSDGALHFKIDVNRISGVTGVYIQAGTGRPDRTRHCQALRSCAADRLSDRNTGGGHRDGRQPSRAFRGAECLRPGQSDDEQQCLHQHRDGHQCRWRTTREHPVPVPLTMESKSALGRLGA